jgi:hypothetical protein
VELDVFSGRPNPHFSVSGSAANDLARLHATLPRGSFNVLEPPALGYRGFVYVLAGSRCRAYRGSVITSSGVLRDAELFVERLLLGEMPSELDSLRARVRGELGLPA